MLDSQTISHAAPGLIGAHRRARAWSEPSLAFWSMGRAALPQGLTPARIARVASGGTLARDALACEHPVRTRRAVTRVRQTLGWN